MTTPVGGQKPLLSSHRPAPLLGLFEHCRRDILDSPVARMDRREKRGWRTSYHRLYGQMSFGDFTHSNGEMTLIAFVLYQGRRAVIELADTLRNKHGGEIAITDFLNSGIEERMLSSQGSASWHRQPCDTVPLTYEQQRDATPYYNL